MMPSWGQKSEGWLYWMPALVFVVMSWDSGDLFARVNIYKTFLLFVSVTLLFLFVDLVLRTYQNDKNVSIQLPPMGWLLMLSLPIIATFPGLLIHGGEYNWLINHEISIHLMYMLWIAYLLRTVGSAEALEKMMLVVGGVIIYVVWIGLEQHGGYSKSTFGNKNLYANFLLVLLPVVLLLLLQPNLKGNAQQRFDWKSWNGKRLFFLLVFLVGVVGLWRTETRAAIAGFSGAMLLLLFYLLFLHLKQRYQVQGWLISLLIFGVPTLLLAVLLIVVFQLSEETIQSSRFLQLVTWEAWSSRFMPWLVAFESFKDAPLFGYGSGSSYNLFFEYLPADSRLFTVSRSYKHAHSELLEVMQEGGLFGLLVQFIVLGMLAWLVLHFLQSDKLDNREKSIVLGAGLGLVAYNFHSIFSLATRMTQNEMTMYTLVAMLLVFYPKAPLQGRVGALLSLQLPKRLPSHWLFLGVILFSWGIQYPTFQGSTELATLAREKVKTVTDVERVTAEYQDSPSVYVLHYLANMQLGSRNGPQMSVLLDRMEEMIPHYRDADYLRFMAYQLTTKKEVDIVKLKALAEAFQARDRYDPRIISWMARIAAFQKDHQEFMQQIRYAAQLHAIQEQQLTIGDIERVTVAVADSLDSGVETHLQPGSIEIKLSQSRLNQMMQGARSTLGQKQQGQLLQAYLKQSRIVVGQDFGDSVREKQAQFTGKLFKQISTWSALPK